MQKRRLGKNNLEVSAMGSGCTKPHRLEENIGAVSVELTPDLRDIEAAASKITVQGARYPKKLEQMTGR